MELNNVYNMNCLIGMKELNNDSIDLIVTSPPYFNAREYSTWGSFNDYMNDMREIFKEAIRVLKNYNMLIVNIGDVICTENGKRSSIKKFPLGAQFVVMLQELGLTYIDDIIWDKGEVQSKRNFVGENYPFQKYPINSYEHILVFRKFEKDKIKPKCPVCNNNIAVSNGVNNQTYTYECTNPECRKSEHGRGVRYSTRQVQKLSKELPDNEIPQEFVKKFRRDIVKINPVIKINNKGENKFKHTAPFPKDIPEYAIRFFSGTGDIVLDMFSGSGTTCLVAKELNRKYLGFELDKDFYEFSLDRIKMVDNS